MIRVPRAGNSASPAVEEAHWRLISALRHQDQARRDRSGDRQALDAFGPVVYFIWRPPHIKIGFSSVLSQRLYQLHSSPKDVLIVVPGTRDDEAAMHERFNAARVWGDGLGREHFWPTADLIEFINERRAAFGAKPLHIQLST